MLDCRLVGYDVYDNGHNCKLELIKLHANIRSSFSYQIANSSTRAVTDDACLRCKFTRSLSK
jgi:hypothetical protein